MADFNLNIDEDFFKDALDDCLDDVKTKHFEDIINLHGCLNREIYLGDIEENAGTDVEGQIRFWNAYDEEHGIPIHKREPIKIYVDSMGGYLTETFTMIDAIKMSKTPVWTICRSTAYSGGFFTFICGHKRIAYPHASFLYHEGSTQSGGTAAQFENYTAFYKKQLSQLKDLVIEKTNITEEQYLEIKKDDIWWDAKEAMENGAVDEIAEDFI